MNAVIAIQQASFIQRLRKHLDQFFHEQIVLLAPDDLKYFIERGLEMANLHKLFSENAITIYFNTFLCMGIEFDEYEDTPWLVRILNNSSLSEDEKISCLIDETTIYLNYIASHGE